MQSWTSIKAEHYLSGASRQEEAVIRYSLKADIRGLRVLVVDDVNDTGDTLEAATQHLQTTVSAFKRWPFVRAVA